MILMKQNFVFDFIIAFSSHIWNFVLSESKLAKNDVLNVFWSRIQQLNTFIKGYIIEKWS
jgi:hypothetical protein